MTSTSTPGTDINNLQTTTTTTKTTTTQVSFQHCMLHVILWRGRSRGRSYPLKRMVAWRATYLLQFTVHISPAISFFSDQKLLVRENGFDVIRSKPRPFQWCHSRLHPVARVQQVWHTPQLKPTNTYLLKLNRKVYRVGEKGHVQNHIT